MTREAVTLERRKTKEGRRKKEEGLPDKLMKNASPSALAPSIHR
jgi:hypothetical protein